MCHKSQTPQVQAYFFIFWPTKTHSMVQTHTSQIMTAKKTPHPGTASKNGGENSQDQSPLTLVSTQPCFFNLRVEVDTLPALAKPLDGGIISKWRLEEAPTSLKKSIDHENSLY